MAGFTDTLHGDGLARAPRALLGLERDPLRLDPERQRFCRSPPSYSSNSAGTTTRSASPNPPSEEQRLRQERRIQLGLEADASKPHEQFSAQIEEERRRIWNADPSTSWIKINPGDTTFEKEARETVKKRWVEQGIWSDKWNQFALGKWKHEEPLNLESESERESEAERSLPLFALFQKPQREARLPKSDDEKRTAQPAVREREREREASRPFHQFVYQISKERERIQKESGNGDGPDAADINTKAYENVKNTWTKRKIWNERWGILPGSSWKHEEPLDEEAVHGLACVPANPFMNSSHETGEAPAIHIFGPRSPVQSEHRETSGALNSPQRGSPADIDAAKPENDDVERSSSPSNSHASLEPVCSSEVSKDAGKRKMPQRRLSILQETCPDGSPLSFGVATAELQSPPSPDRVAPRRSKRVQAVRAKPTRSPGKSRGVSKRHPAQTIRGRKN